MNVKNLSETVQPRTLNPKSHKADRMTQGEILNDAILKHWGKTKEELLEDAKKKYEKERKKR
jgi:hypothetical protein